MAEDAPKTASSRGIEIKIDDQEARGRYSNLLRVTHTREEFVLDFIHLVAPQGVVTARVVTSPSHLKRVIRALEANMARYEELHGALPEPQETQLPGDVH